MLIHQEENYRVLQHEYLQIYYIQKWMVCDNPRSYDQHWDYGGIKTVNSIEEVNQYFIDNVWGKDHDKH